MPPATKPPARKATRSVQRAPRDELGFNLCLVVVGYASSQEPFRLIGRVSADTGESALPDPPLTNAEMQPVAFAAKLALAKVLAARRSASGATPRRTR